MAFKNFVFFATIACLLVLAAAQDDVNIQGEVDRIREHVLAGNFVALTRILREADNITTVATGFRYEPGTEDVFLRTTERRFGDPDVNAIQGFARAALDPSVDPDILAQIFTEVMVLQGDDFLVNPAGTFMGLFESFSNSTEMQEILDADPTEARRRMNLRRQMLVVGSPADTMLCANCFEKKFCAKNAPWC